MDELTAVRLAEMALMAATALALVWAGAPGERPWRVAARSLWRVLGSRRRWLYVAACGAVFAVNHLLLKVDAQCTAWVVEHRGGDFAELIHQRIEGDAVARLQEAVAWLPLTWAFAYAYVIAFPCLVLALMIAFDHRGDRHGLALVLAAYLLNFLLVLPFYVCVPVRETFVYYQETGLGPPAARLLLDDISPWVMKAYRATSGVDNCFPSFHTSLSVTMGLAAWHVGRRFGALLSAIAAAIVLSTIYLGVHWLTDVAAGLVVGVAAYALARRIARSWQAPAEGAHE